MQQPWPTVSELPTLADDGLHVWSVSLDDVRMRLVDSLMTFAPDERERAAQFRVEAARRRFIAARAALRRLLGGYLRMPPSEVALDYDARGKPRLHDSSGNPDLRFNLGHSGELALIAVTRGSEVGVDVELLRSVHHWREIAQRYFHPEEVNEISALPSGDQVPAFLRCWTGKEAVLKAVGFGITQPLDFFVGSSSSANGVWIELKVAGQTRRCHLRSLQLDNGYLGSVACLNATRALQCFAMA